jgi:23S rRNA (uracil1939-C5)-methyltransferase
MKKYRGDENILCPYMERCGGCPLLGLDYEEQLRQKKEVLRQAFLRNGWSAAAIPAIKVIPSRPFEYRDRIQLRRVPPGAEPALPAGKSRIRALKLKQEPESVYGFMSSRSRAAPAKAAPEIVPVKDCPVAAPVIRQALRSGGIVPPVDRDRFCVYGKDSTLLVEGRLSRGVVRIRGKDIKVDAGVFFQSNGTLLEPLIDEILHAAEDADKRLPAADLYCGVGTFGIFLRDFFDRLDLLEAEKDALRLARENVNLPGARFFGQNDDVWARNAEKAVPAARGGYGFAVADPGRRGLCPAMSRFLGANCGLLCYVSCNPNALARDAALLSSPEVGPGLELISLSFYDFYPQTKHIESLAIFRRRSSSLSRFSPGIIKPNT